ncbi:uncharacterized protein L201_007418 [Kwoniella dendrophila CBS 6074]|uniref:Zn(2)-C6 fungal-type domain-containing protein n=1 Tax=Kwoniella dendrophila CBS 6074 TaxID=1295534 RepID=A0AAX4K6L6_9TREE
MPPKKDQRETNKEYIEEHGAIALHKCDWCDEHNFECIQLNSEQLKVRFLNKCSRCTRRSHACKYNKISVQAQPDINPNLKKTNKKGPRLVVEIPARARNNNVNIDDDLGIKTETVSTEAFDHLQAVIEDPTVTPFIVDKLKKISDVMKM